MAQSRDAPVYPESSYTTGYSSGAGNSAYGAPAATSTQYGAPAAGGYGGTTGSQYGAQPGGNTGYYYYYYPVQVGLIASFLLREILGENL